jgi:hypothetical protein
MANVSRIDRWMSESTEASRSPTVENFKNQSMPWQSSPPRILDGLSVAEQHMKTLFGPFPYSGETSHVPSMSVCLDLFVEHIYPIMPLIHVPTLRATLSRPLRDFERNFMCALCAVTSTHMSGKSIPTPALGPISWEAVGRHYLNECIAVRQSYDFIEDKSLLAVISSYFMSTAHFEINQSRKSWYYLREAMTMAQDLKLHDESSYENLSEAEALCRRRTFWILYVTERSFAILRHKPLTLSKTPGFPATTHEYESHEIHAGFSHLVQTFSLLDENFVNSWNEASSTPNSIITYSALQERLNTSGTGHLDLTNTQKADILVTQQWLRLIVWQSSMRQGLLSSNASDPSMTFKYPLQIARSLLEVISSLPTTSIEVHGMGIFEKIFEVGCSMVDVVQASAASSQSSTSTMSTHGLTQDPFEMFVQTLSQTPNSQKLFANLLLAKAAEKPEIRRYSLGTSLLPLPGSVLDEQGSQSQEEEGYVPQRPRGSIVEFPEGCNVELEEWLGTQGWDIGVSAGWK